MRLIAFVLISAACAAGAGALRAQDVAGPASSGQTFRTAIRLIQVSVVVHDGRKRPVEGLRTEDFQIFEDGKEQPVAFFSVRGNAAPAPSMSSKGIFTNRVESPPGGGVVALVYDQLNTSRSDQARVREHLVKFLSQVNPDDRIGLYVLNGSGMGILHDFNREADERGGPDDSAVAGRGDAGATAQGRAPSHADDYASARRPRHSRRRARREFGSHRLRHYHRGGDPHSVGGPTRVNTCQHV